MHKFKCRLCGKETSHKLCLQCENKTEEERKERLRGKEREYYDRNVAKKLVKIARERANELGVVCTITDRDISVPDLCPIRLVPMHRNRGRFDHDSYTLDRVDARYGYVAGNVRVISWLANNAKNNLSVDEVERLLKYMRGEI